MKKLERRAIICLAIAAVLIVGMGIFIFRFVTQGEKWVSFYANSHIYSNGHLIRGKIYDVDGALLARNTKDGTKYHSNSQTRKATAHVVGDAGGYVYGSAQTAFRDRLIGYNLITGVYSLNAKGRNVKLSIDRQTSVAAYEALGSREGLAAVYNYETGEILAMVSTPSFDPKNPPAAEEATEGTYMNKTLTGNMTPGSIFKLVTSAAAIENLDGLSHYKFHCNGSYKVGNNWVRCTHAHGDVDFKGALSQSCNGAFADLSLKLGSSNIKEYIKKSGLKTSYDIDGIKNVPGSFEISDSADSALAWTGIGQWKDLINPCSMMVYMSAIATDGRGTEPGILHEEGRRGRKTERMIEESTAKKLKKMMKNNVDSEYGQSRFPGLNMYAKTGTAEVEGKKPNAWFCGFIDNPDHPYAFIVCVEDSGAGIDFAAPVANSMLQEAVKR